MSGTLKRNAVRCKKCDTVIESKYTHDFKRCPCGSVMVDGGLDYARYGWPGGDISEWLEMLYEYE